MADAARSTVMTERRRAAGDTHPGLQRTNNEDRFFFDDRRGVYCVIDGVGGHNAGERAAEIAADTIRAALAAPPGLTDGRLRDALARANEAIHEAATRNAALAGMACVATLAVVEGGRCRFAHVGDTRLYKIQGGRIAKLTHDHSPVGELEDAGSLSEIEAMRHPRRNEIYRDLGSNRFDRQDTAIEIGQVAFEADAALVLCSDGLSDQVSSASVRRIVESFAGSPALAVQELITAANDAGGKDNVTALVVEGEGFAAASRARAGARATERSPSTAASATPAILAKPAESPKPANTRKPANAQIGGQRAGATERSEPAPRASRSGWSRALWLAAGLVLGAGLALTAERFGLVEMAWQRLVAPVARAPRVWQVGLQASADFATIGEALRAAVAGDTVSIGPGEYREAVVFKNGVSIEGARTSVLKPPLGASGTFTAITIRNVASGRLSGLTVAGTPEQPVGTAVLVERSSVVIDGLDISGAVATGVDLGAGGQPVLRQSFLHDNPGVAVAIRARAEPRLERNVILHSGSPGAAAAPAVLVEPGARPTIVGNGLAGRGGPAVQGWPAAGLPELMRQNVISPDPVARRPEPERRRGAAR